MTVINNVLKLDGAIVSVILSNHSSQEIDGKGLTLLPALIDPHVHFRVPGDEHKENWLSASQACIESGITTVIDMPNNRPSCTTFEDLLLKHKLIQNQLHSAGIPLRYFLYFGADRRHLGEIAKVKKHAIAIKVFMGSSTGNLLIDDEPSLNEVFRIAADLDMLVSVHAEDENIIRDNKLRYSGCNDPAAHSKIRSRDAAIKAVERAISLAAKYGTRLCILHMSTKEEVALLRQAKLSGVNVHGEVAPHHLFLSTEDYSNWGTKVQVNPPLREPEDQECLWRALNEGTIDFIGTDHAPHTLQEKSLPYGQAPSGIPSVELLLPLLLDACNKGKLNLQTLVKATRTNIEKIFRLPPHDDYVLVDMKAVKTVSDENLKTKCRWSPYSGRHLQGWPNFTIIDQKLFQLKKEKSGSCPQKH